MGTKSLLQLTKLHSHLLDKMIGQSKISAFFTPCKRPSSSDADDLECPLQKRLKCSNPESPPHNKNPGNGLASVQISPQPFNLALTPEQKERREIGRKAALACREEKENISSDDDELLSNVGSSWRNALNAEFSKTYFKQLRAFVSKERKKGKVFPPADQVFTWTRMCKITEVKVVILGQDPYHGHGQAHGLCFSVPQGVPPPPSLQNIFKELADDIDGFKHPGHGTLTGWAKQGVLLLNACLTVGAHQANSHAEKGWEQFTDAVISWLNKNSTGIVFMLWGANAQKKGACIDKKKHHVLKTVHPSPLSVHRGFFGCKHFSRCNELLKKRGKTPIDWTSLPTEL